MLLKTDRYDFEIVHDKVFNYRWNNISNGHKNGDTCVTSHWYILINFVSKQKDEIPITII